ncbi:MAG: bifunctional phosphoribosylaminoimidazolecarboxamide formyltransferase/IMP cyclohydrolase [Candidatus Omnitrophica bacterium]|nr:bifunctional phosphoribosylaminoimidazolecarboxamide formyltransferase/IMP cyclohydrolase [Candidatus Omnitrophota bacterium]
MISVRRALLSCHDKSDLGPFAKALAGLGVDLIASGGTAAFLQQQGLSVKTVEAFTGATEQLDGRVKTLHPKIHAGILARRDDPAHVRAVGADGLIDLVVVNLYPFEETARRGASVAEAVEQIDIGGVALLRAAAKNFAHVAAVCEPSQYAAVAESLRRDQGRLPDPLARELAAAAFRLTSRYDTSIGSYLAGAGEGISPAPAGPGSRALPEVASLSVRRRQMLRYGENPHQPGAWYVPAGAVWGLATLTQRQGKELSYNNLLDADAVLRCLLDFEEPACAVVKHRAPCGLASASEPLAACQRALACDPESAFGGIVGCNRPLGAALAEQLTATFLEVVVAPSVEAEAAAVFARKPNLRVVTLEWPPRLPAGAEWRSVLGSWLLQEPDASTVNADALRVATKRAPTERERGDLVFAWTAAKHALSNGIVLASDRATVGIGQGQPSRVGAVRLALEKAGGRARKAVAASDGFFPFPDSIELLAKAGVTAVIQPGGSVRDAEAAAAADAAGLAMLLTGIRHFRH